MFGKEEIIVKQFRISCYSRITFEEEEKRRVYRTGGQEKRISRGTRGINLRGDLQDWTSLAMNSASDVRYTKIDRYIYKDLFNIISFVLMYLLSCAFFRLHM